GAVAGAARGHALRLVAREPRATRVTWLGARVRAGQAADRALRVVHGRVLRLDRAAAPTGGGARPAHRRADRGLGGAGDRHRGAVVPVHPRPQGVARRDLYPGVVVAGEARAAEDAAGLRRRVACPPTVAGGDEPAVGAAASHGEPDGAPGTADVVGVPTDHVDQGTGRLGRLDHADRVLSHASVGDELLRRRDIVREHDDGVADGVDVPARDAARSRRGVEPGLDRVQLALAAVDQAWRRTHATYLRRGRGVGDVHRERGGVGIEVRTAERGAELLAERTLGAAGPVLPCEASQCLLLGEFEVTLHRGDDLTRWS